VGGNKIKGITEIRKGRSNERTTHGKNEGNGG
jgi:hypothetical protein